MPNFLRIEIQGYLSIRLALWNWNSDVCILVGPNGSGKTQQLDLVFSILFAGWKAKDELDKMGIKKP